MSDTPTPPTDPDDASAVEAADAAEAAEAAALATLVNNGGGGGIEPIEIQTEMERSFLDYAMSVITARALPDARDGLKPVHRRILYGMYDNGYRPDRSHVKSARITGDVMGKYHPHGNLAIYDALVRMAQDFSLRHPLIDGHGNFGSPDDMPAAERYTESRLAPIAMVLLDGLDESTVDFAPNYDGHTEEPTVLPARFPNLLVNGSQGIAVGMATNIPPHNMGEVIDAVVHLLDHPDATVEDLMGFVKGPDFPTSCLILGRAGILDAYRTGRGSVKMRAVAEIVEDKKGAMAIEVTAIPYQTSIGDIAGKIAELVTSKELDGIRDVRNLSAQAKTRLMIDLKRDANPNVVLNNLYKATPMQTSFGVNMVALDHGVPRIMNLLDLVRAYVDHQVEVLTRRSQHRLDEAQRDAHILEGLLRAVIMIDAIIAAIRGSDDRDDAKNKLMAGPFEFSVEQATRILEMQLGQLTRLSQINLQERLDKRRGEIAELELILGDRAKLNDVIRTELADVRAKHATPRRSKITHDPGDMNVEDLIDDKELVVVMTRAGYIKTVEASAFRTQTRGGRGKSGGTLKQDDLVSHIVSTTAHAYLLFFSNRGKVYRLKAHEIPERDRTAKGMPIVNLLPLSVGESIQAIIETRGYAEDRFLFFATKLGTVKKTTFSEYDSSRRDGLIAINLHDGDELVRVIETSGTDDILMVSRNGMTIRFNEDEVRSMGRTAAGVRGMKMRAGDEVVSCDLARDDVAILIMTESGYGKRTQLDKFNAQGRGGQGVIGIRLTAKKGYVVAAFMVSLDDEIFAMSSAGVTIRVAAREISSQGRDATGVRIMSLEPGQVVASVALILNGDDED